MSTRCNIIIKDYGKKCYLYHHSDGYPEHVGRLLKKFLKDYGEKEDVWDGEAIATSLVKEGVSYKTVSPITGKVEDRCDDYYHCSIGLHGDIEYLYVIDCEKEKLTCYSVSSFEESRITRNANIVEIPDYVEPKEK